MKRLNSQIACTFTLTIILAGSTHAQIALDGYFIAQQQCPAFQSFRQETNPGNITTVLDHAYRLRGKNNHAATHFLIEVAGAEPTQRWVAVTCGIHVIPADGSHIGTPPGTPSAAEAEALLAVSWQPAFCETKPGKPECTSMTTARFDATHLALHGLWPQPRSKAYCGVPQSEGSFGNESEVPVSPGPLDASKTSSAGLSNDLRIDDRSAE